MKHIHNIKSGSVKRAAYLLLGFFTFHFSLFTFTSCVDTALLPENKTVDEDFWKTKSDVALMVNGAYQSMLNANIITRLIVWGDFRSDELIPNTDVPTDGTKEDLAEIATANIETTNMASNWQSFYSVINNCNIVINKAPGVVGTDPDYTEGDLAVDVAQMKTLRSLCYFYLVRAFRDVPYITEAYMENSQEMNVAQSAPSVVLQGCINDLLEAAGNIYDPQAFPTSNWRRRGYFNRDAVYALLADIYLWRASVLHGSNPQQAMADYRECAKYCQMVIDSKNAAHTNYTFGGQVVDADDPYPALAPYATDFYEIFVQGNAEESIFELQFNGNNNSNTALCQMFYKYKNNNSAYGYMRVPQIFGLKATSNDAGVFIQSHDGRLNKFVYGGHTTAEYYGVRKMISESVNTTYASPESAGYTREERAYDYFAQNYVIYRMTDVMLMEAEALTQIAALEGGNETTLRQAFDLLKAVNDRAIYEVETTNASEALKWDNYKTVEDMETMVLGERLRELCFEGKRYYDLLRYGYRENAKLGLNTNYDAILADQSGFIPNASKMMALLTRTSDSPSAIISKMPTEPYLYMPILQSEIEVNPLLKQNPVYSSSDVWNKNVN